MMRQAKRIGSTSIIEQTTATRDVAVSIARMLNCKGVVAAGFGSSKAIPFRFPTSPRLRLFPWPHPPKCQHCHCIAGDPVVIEWASWRHAVYPGSDSPFGEFSPLKLGNNGLMFLALSIAHERCGGGLIRGLRAARWRQKPDGRLHNW